MTSESLILAQPSPTGNPAGNEIFSPVTSINYSIAIDPIKYIRVPFSFYYFEPHNNIINKDGIPSKPPPPCRSIVGFYSHFLIFHFWFADSCTESRPVSGTVETELWFGFSGPP